MTTKWAVLWLIINAGCVAWNLFAIGSGNAIAHAAAASFNAFVVGMIVADLVRDQLDKLT